MYTDEELKERILNYDNDTTLCFLGKYKLIIYNIVISFTPLKPYAEQLTQDFITRFLYEGPLASFNPNSGSLRTFMNRVLRYWLIDRLRHMGRIEPKGPAAPIFTTQESAYGNPAVEVEKHEIDSIIRKHVEKLDPEYQIVIQLFYYKGLSYKEIGTELGIPKGTVCTHLIEARKMLWKSFPPELKD